MTNYNDNNNPDFNDDLSITINGEDDSEFDDDGSSTEHEKYIKNLSDTLHALYYPAEFLYDFENDRWSTQIAQKDDAIYSIRQRMEDDALIKPIFVRDHALDGKLTTEYSFATVDINRLSNKLLDQLIVCRVMLAPKVLNVAYGDDDSEESVCAYPHLSARCVTQAECKTTTNLYNKLKKQKFIAEGAFLLGEDELIFPRLDWYGVMQTSELNASPEIKRAMLDELEALAKYIAKYGEKNTSDPVLKHLITLGDELNKQIDNYHNSAPYNVLVFKKELIATIEDSAFMCSLSENYTAAEEKSYDVLLNILRLITSWGASLFKNLKKTLPPSFLDTSQEKGEKIEKEIQRNIGKILNPNAGSGFFSAGSLISVPKPMMKCRY